MTYSTRVSPQLLQLLKHFTTYQNILKLHEEPYSFTANQNNSAAMVKPLTEVQKAGFAALRAARAAKQQAKDVKKNEIPGLQKRKAEQDLAAGPSERVVKKVKV